jgi:hypothetical protein
MMHVSTAQQPHCCQAEATERTCTKPPMACSRMEAMFCSARSCARSPSMTSAMRAPACMVKMARIAVMHAIAANQHAHYVLQPSCSSICAC